MFGRMHIVQSFDRWSIEGPDASLNSARSKEVQSGKLDQNGHLNNRASVVSPSQPKGLTPAPESPHFSLQMVI